MLWELFISKYDKSAKKEDSWRTAFPLDERKGKSSNRLFTGNWRRNWVYNSADQRIQGILNLYCNRTKFWYCLPSLRKLYEVLWNLFSNTFWHWCFWVLSFLALKWAKLFIFQSRDYNYDLENENQGQLIDSGKSSLQCLAKPSLVSWLQFPSGAASLAMLSFLQFPIAVGADTIPS